MVPGTGIALQKNLDVGARDHVLFGRNEGGGQALLANLLGQRVG